MKRFYKSVSVAPCGQGGGFEIHLDGRPIRLPDTKSVLSVSTRDLADAIAAEWEAQGAEVVPDSMPMMQIACTCLEKVAVQRAAMQAQILRYVDTDLLYYRTDKPPELLEAQEAAWDPLLAMFAERYGVDFQITQDLVALKQDVAVHEAVRRYCEGLTDAEFTVLQIAVPLSGSVITGILFTSGDLTVNEVLDVARVEERFKDGIYDAEKYGPDPSIEKADKAMMADLLACLLFLDFS